MDFSRDDFAVLLNENARKVSKKVRDKVAEIVPRANLFYTHTLEDASKAMEEMILRGKQTIFCGGGDGTLVNLLTLWRQTLNRLVAEKKLNYQTPTIAPLKLGTGNAWAGFVGAKKGIEPIRSYLNAAKEKLTRFNLIEFEDKIFHFAGLGWDAAILNDYIWMKQRASFAFARAWMNSLMGYLTSVSFKTIPQQILTRNRPKVKIIADGPVYQVSRKEPPRLIECPGGVIYEGPCNAAGVATVPEYGFRLKAFPFARDKEGFMNLRIITAGVIELVAHSISIWRGKYESRNFKDFLAQKVEMIFDRPMPFQIGGDAVGYQERVTFSVSDFTVDVLHP